MAQVDFGNYPFPPDQKRPVHIQGEMIKHFIFPGDMPHDSVSVDLYVSTDRFSAGVWALGPGAKNKTPDWHEGGDEAYYILDGVLTLHNPLTGDFVQAKRGEAMFIPAQAYHKGYNFEQDIMRALYVTASNIATDRPPPLDFGDGRMNMYKGALAGQNPRNDRSSTTTLLPATDRIGSWPVPGPEARREPILFYRITEGKKLINVHGTEHPTLLKFFVSNDLLNVGEFTLPAGGTGPRASEPDSHNGDCFLFVEKGPITVFLPDTQDSYKIQIEEGMFIPEGVSYQLINYTSEPVKVIFSVVPEL